MEDFSKFHKLEKKDEYIEYIENLKNIATFLRKDILEIINSADNGHIWGCLSSVELLTALYFWWIFKFDLENPKNPYRDRVLIRGHLWPVRYSIFSLMDYIPREELRSYRKLWSRLQWHEDMYEVPGVDITPSGSLGMLLSYWVGSAIESKEQWINNNIVIFLWDWEEQEWNVSEAARHASSLGLKNLICIIDKNGKQLSRATNESDWGSDLRKIWEGYGWNVEVIEDGHNIEEILSIYKKIQSRDKQTLIIANTIKGYWVKECEKHFNGYHTLSSVEDKTIIKEAIKSLRHELSNKNIRIDQIKENIKSYIAPVLKINEHISGTAIEKIYDIEYQWSSWGSLEIWQSQFFKDLHENIVKFSLDPKFYIITPDLLRKDIVIKSKMMEYARFIDTWIREQHAIAMAHGISVENPEARIYVCYGDAFLYRAMDQINAAAQGKSNILISWENAWIFQGKNGKTHQSVGQLAALLGMPEIKVYEPSDIVDLYNVYSQILSKNKGLSYVRLHRGNVELERNLSDNKRIDAYYVHKPDSNIKFTIIASWFMLENAVQAAKKMETVYNIPTGVINVINQWSLSYRLLDLLESSAPILTVYNGNPNILKNSVSWAILENPDIPRPKFIAWHGVMEGTSWSVEDLIKFYKLDSNGILETAMMSIKNNK